MVKENNDKPHFNQIKNLWMPKKKRKEKENRFVRTIAGGVFANCITNQERFSFQNNFFLISKNPFTQTFQSIGKWAKEASRQITGEEI